MALDLEAADTATDSAGTDTGYGKDPVGQSSDDCKQKAESEGGYAYDEHAQACWRIYGKAVTIGENENSIMEGFQITNFNFSVNGDQPAVPTQDDLPGDVEAESKSITV